MLFRNTDRNTKRITFLEKRKWPPLGKNNWGGWVGGRGLLFFYKKPWELFNSLDYTHIQL